MNLNSSRIPIQDAMRSFFPEYEDRVGQFYAMQQYHLGWRNEQLEPAYAETGKLLRPYFVLLASRIAGGSVEQTMPLAAAIQLIHDFTLIHDDIEDQSDTRRGRQTVWKLWGVAQGINTGDGMLIIAHLALTRLVEVGISAEIALEVIKQFDQAILTVCEGQFLDLNNEGNLATTEADYLAMIQRKTAALIAASCSLGAKVGGANDRVIQAFSDFGLNLGLAFQIQDDVLGIWGDPETTGKPAAADLYRHKLSLPIIYALQHAGKRQRLAELYSRSYASDEDVAEMLDILAESGAREYIEQMALAYHEQAIAALDSIEPLDAQAHVELRAIAMSLLGRNV
jgi:geranylgeranyl diphosphate synthase type I